MEPAGKQIRAIVVKNDWAAERLRAPAQTEMSETEAGWSSCDRRNRDIDKFRSCGG